MLFTTVVANLSVIVGHDIDGQPLPLTNSSSTLIQPTLRERLQRILDPCDLLKRGRHHYFLPGRTPSTFYAVHFVCADLSFLCCIT